MNTKRGVTLAEVLVSAGLFTVITAGFVTTYSLGHTSAAQGGEKTDSMRRLREAVQRFTPIISSACPTSTETSALLEPLQGAAAQSSLRFTTTREYADLYVARLLNATNQFNPVDPVSTQYQTVRLFFQSSSSPSFPGGRRGDLKLDLDTNSNTGDDLTLARGLYDCTFQNVGSNTLLIHLEIRRPVRTAGGKTTVQPYTLDSRLFLPYYTNTAGGGG